MGGPNTYTTHTNTRWRKAAVLKKNRKIVISQQRLDRSKFGTMMHISIWTVYRQLKFRTFEYPRLRTVAILQTVKLPSQQQLYRSTSCYTLPILPHKTANFVKSKLESVSLSCTRRPASADKTARRQFQATGQPVCRTQASDAMTSRLPRYEAKCVQRRCFQCGSSLCVQISRERSYPVPIYWYHSKGNWLRYNFAAETLYIMKLFSRLFVLYW